MSYEFDATIVAKKARLMHGGFATIGDDVAQEFADQAWLVVNRVKLPDDMQELGTKLYTAHLLYNYSFGGMASGNNESLEAGPLKKSTTGGSYFAPDKIFKDPFYHDWLDLVRRYGKGWGIGLGVVQ
jgi:hypothetical protein